MNEFTFAGFIYIDYSEDFRTIKLINETEIDLVKKFRAIFDLFNSEVSVSYFISDSKQSESEIKEGWLKQLFGDIFANYETTSYWYSEITNGVDYDTYLKIGGHDLFDEFYDFNGKYCILKIKLK